EARRRERPGRSLRTVVFVARLPRCLQAGLYHVGSRGSDTRHLCLEGEDRDEFERRLGEICRRYELGLVSYVILGNHYHAVFRIPDARLSKALQLLHGGYSRHHNRVHGRRAHLFQAHCFVVEIESDRQLMTVARYVARNPFEAGLVDHPFRWRWGSARALAGFEAARIPLDESPLQAAFDDSVDWRRRFQAIVAVENV